MIFGIPWRLALAIAGALAFLGAVYFFGAWQYGLGVSGERAKWVTAEARVSRETAHASVRIAQQNQQTNGRIGEALAHGREALQALPHEADARMVLIAWADADRRLCDAANASGGDHRV